MGRIILWALVIVGIIFIAWIIVPILSASCYNPDSDRLNMPKEEKATHSFHIKNTGGLILSSDYEQHGQEVGSRIFVLHGYWEMRGTKFKFMDRDVTLDENIFGPITVKRR